MIPANQNNPTASQAFAFADRAAILLKFGIPAIPLDPQSKKASLPDWQNLATTDADQIAKWNKKNPNYNCAAVARSGGFWILDVDDPSVFARIEKDTSHSLDELDTLVVKSSGGKRHFYFKHNKFSEFMGNRKYSPNAKEMFSVRARNAYVVSAGSIHPDTKQPYETMREPALGVIPTAPPWLTNWLLAQAANAPKAAASVEPEIIPEGGRNNRLTSEAGKMRRIGMDPSAIFEALKDFNRKHCAQPLDEAEVKRIAESVGKYAPPEHGGLKANLVPLSNIDAEIQEWLWQNRIPKNALTNLSGVADKGKSLVLYDILARISNGSDFPDGAKNPFGQPKKVLLMFSEGSLKTTVKPRMMVMGANMENVLALKSVSSKGEQDSEKRQFYLETDLNLLREALRNDPEIVAAGFDPLTNYLGDKCNMYCSQDVRRVLTPLGELAEDCGVTIISIIHFNKNREMNAIHRTGGAAALVEVPRAAWCCMDDDDPENRGGFVFVRIKNNLGKRVGGLCYRIEETFIPIKGQNASEPQLVWGKPTEKIADDLLSLQNDPEQKGVAKARSWLEETFKDDLARRSSTVFAAALAVGITADCVKNARRSLRMQSKILEWQGPWYMRRHQNESQPWVVSTDLEDKSTGDSNDESAF